MREVGYVLVVICVLVIFYLNAKVRHLKEKQAETQYKIIMGMHERIRKLEDCANCHDRDDD